MEEIRHLTTRGPSWPKLNDKTGVQILPVEEMQRYKEDTILDMLQFLELDEPPQEQLQRALAVPSSETRRRHEKAASAE